MNEKIAKKGIAIITAKKEEKPKFIIVFINNHCTTQTNNTKKT